MKRQWIMSVAALLVTGCDGVLGIESAESLPPAPIPECTTDAQCSSRDSACTRFVCEEGACVQQFVDFGIPIQEQKAGDCTVQVCDGFGRTTPQVDPFDVQDDQNPCTLDQCVGSTLRHIPQADVNIPCYEGPPGTEGIGICQSGVIECDSIGNLIGCKGQVLPQAEVCQTAIDENCNGLSTLTEGCQCGDGIVSGNEQCDDGNTSDADDCSATCSVQRVEQLVSGAVHLCALLSTGEMKCWGLDNLGQLGVDGEHWWGWDKPWEMGANLPPVYLPPGRKIKQIHALDHTTCVVFEDGGARCWGFNHHCALGLPERCPTPSVPNSELSWTENPDALPRDIPIGGSVASIEGSHAHKCALLTDGRVKCWGYNGEGALGLADNDAIDHSGPTNTIKFFNGKDANGNDVEDRVVTLASGGFHNCALSPTGAVRCWGYNGDGQLGRNNNISYGRNVGEMGQDLKPIPLGQPAIAIAAGWAHSCALLSNRRIKCWGNNQFGQLGIGGKANWGADTTNKVEFLPYVPMPLPAGAYVTGIHARWLQTCALISDGTARCWGDNQFDQALASDDQKLSPMNIDNANFATVIDFGPDARIVSLAQTNLTTCALLSTGNVKCWGTAPWHFGADMVNGEWIGDSIDEIGPNIPTTCLFSDVW